MNKLQQILLFTFFISLLNLPSVKSQFLNDEFCGNKEVLSLDYRKQPWKGANQFLFDYLKKIDYQENIDSVRYLVPVKFLLYRNDDGTGGVTDKEIKNFMDSLNYFQKFNNTGFRFYIRETTSINKTKRLELGYFTEAPIQTILHHKKGCINVYIAELIKKKVKGTPYMVRGTYNIATKSVVLQHNTSNTGLSHEIGHYFGLLHPHRNQEKGKSKQESVSRTRSFNSTFKKGLICERNGDGLADTPAEPRLNFLVDNNCEFKGQALTDNWGDHYQLETSNIMSYPTHYKCRHSYTLSQKSVMLYKASKNKFAKNWTTAKIENNIYQFDSYEPNNTIQMAGIILNEEKQNHNFHNIFIPGKNKSGQDQADWLNFKLPHTHKGNKVQLIFTSTDTLSANIEISLFDENKNLINTINIAKGSKVDKLNVQNLISGWYYIKISLNESNLKQLFRYSVELEVE